MGDSDYSFSLTTFSPSGKLVQIEYALNAVQSGSTSLGIKGSVLSQMSQVSYLADGLELFYMWPCSLLYFVLLKIEHDSFTGTVTFQQQTTAVFGLKTFR